MREHATALAEAIDAALPRWVEWAVETVAARSGTPVTPSMRMEAARAGERAKAEIGAEIRALLETDIDDQRSTPLSVLRSVVRYPTEVLRGAGVPPRTRDSQQQRLFPDDVYDLAPATFSDLGSEVGERGIAWAAAKAHTHLQRHAGKR